MAQLADTRGGKAGGSNKEVTDMGAGVLEGGKALAKGLYHGAVGIITKPLEGAEKGGFSGFMEGVAKVGTGLPVLSA